MPKSTPEQTVISEEQECKVTIDPNNGSAIGTQPINHAIKFTLGDLEPSNRPEDLEPSNRPEDLEPSNRPEDLEPEYSNLPIIVANGVSCRPGEGGKRKVYKSNQ